MSTICKGTSGHNIYVGKAPDVVRHIVCDECGMDLGSEWALKTDGYGVGHIPMHTAAEVDLEP